jgi:MFS family permease
MTTKGGVAEKHTFFFVFSTGTGLGFSATPPLVVIEYFFHLRRGLALAVVVSGAGVGMFIAGPLVQALLNLYGLQGTFLVLAAISANHLVLGALMRPSDHLLNVTIRRHKEYST